MPSLSRRNAAPLLRTVKGKPHATQDDHTELLPTPPDSNSTRSSLTASSMMEAEDINRSPASSDDENPVESANTPSFRPSRQIDGASDETPQMKTLQKPTSSPPRGTESKRSQFFEPRSSDNDSMVFETNNFKRRKTGSLVNFHAPPRKLKEYGKRQRHSWQDSSKSAVLKPSRIQVAKPEENTPARVEFKLAKGRDVFDSNQKAQEPGFRFARDADDIRASDTTRATSLSPSVSSLSSARSSPDAEEKKKLGLPAPTPSKTECAICGEQVDVLVKEEFENTFTKGQSILNYKWQQRFCRWHSKQDAKRKQLERGYPNVNWECLERRMRRHHAHLREVMAGSKASYYRDQLSEKVKERSKTAMQVYNDGAKRGASVGYYGPRGERVMTEHIINHLSDKLREQSSKDRLVAAAGVSGGVSGFVQAVLVPELAEQLIMEDMKVSSERSREIIAESAELGELLHPDVDDNVTEVERS